MIITMTDVMIRIFHYVILVAYASCSEFACAESSQLYILPTDHVTNNVSCPQNDCCTLNEWIESDLLDEIVTNEIYTVVLLPGVHVVNTTRSGLFIYDIDSIAFTGVNGKAVQADFYLSLIILKRWKFLILCLSLVHHCHLGKEGM